MHLEFRDGFCTPSEPSARVWHKGNDPHCPIAVDVDLQKIQRRQLASWIPLTNIPLTVKLASMNVLLLASKWWAPAKKLAPLMLRYRRWTFRMREGKKEQRPNPTHAMRRRRACVYFYRNANTCPVFSDSPVLHSSQSPLGLCHSSVVYCLWRVGSTF